MKAIYTFKAWLIDCDGKPTEGIESEIVSASLKEATAKAWLHAHRDLLYRSGIGTIKMESVQFTRNL